MKAKRIKILSVIGTRPQYVKYTPIYKSLLKYDVDHIIVDTNQHYSDSVSKNIIKSLGLVIDRNMNIKNSDAIEFISSALINISRIIKDEKPDCLFSIGDTNSTFAACLAAHKLGIPVCHIEAGGRSNTNKEEEFNRQYADSVSTFNFCSTAKAMLNVYRGVHSGDLEYELLNEINPEVTLGDYSILTMHRKENMTVGRFNEIFSFLSKLNINIEFLSHHTPINFMKDNDIALPDNITLLPAQNYSDMVTKMANCKFIFTDSGGIQKTAPFFGKRCVVLRDTGDEWEETYEAGIAKRFIDLDIFKFLEDYRVNRHKNFYMKDGIPSRIIVDEVLSRIKK